MDGTVEPMQKLSDVNVLNQSRGDSWFAYNGDSVEVLRALPSDSVGFSVFSPPYASLYVYSDSVRDIGNCSNPEEFMENMEFIGEQLLRVMMPGRDIAVDCMQLPSLKERDGHIGIKDFRGDLIRLFEKCGFYFHAEACIWQNPVTSMQRTKALGLLHKQIKKDSAMSRMGLNRYLCVFRKPGDNPKPIEHTNENYPVNLWQRVASGIWATIKEFKDGFAEFEDPNKDNPDKAGIDFGDTLQRFRESDSEPHLCPMQLEIIRRAIHLWSAPGDVVLDPFAGLFSTGYVAVKEGRKAIMIELKGSYFDQGVRNMNRAETEVNENLLF